MRTTSSSITTCNALRWRLALGIVHAILKIRNNLLSVHYKPALLVNTTCVWEKSVWRFWMTMRVENQIRVDCMTTPIMFVDGFLHFHRARIRMINVTARSGPSCPRHRPVRGAQGAPLQTSELIGDFTLPISASPPTRGLPAECGRASMNGTNRQPRNPACGLGKAKRVFKVHVAPTCQLIVQINCTGEPASNLYDGELPIRRVMLLIVVGSPTDDFMLNANRTVERRPG